jgi:hypothetical protein
MDDTVDLSGPLAGAWELVSGSYVGEGNAVVNYDDAEVKSLKVLSGNRFSFTTTAKGAFYAAGSGEYLAKDGLYVEIPSLASVPEMVGRRYEFRYRLDGDTWTNERWQDGVRMELEVWKKVR